MTIDNVKKENNALHDGISNPNKRRGNFHQILSVVFDVGVSLTHLNRCVEWQAQQARLVEEANMPLEAYLLILVIGIL